MPVAALPNTCVVFGRGCLDELEDFTGGRTRSKHCTNADLMQGRVVFVGDDAATKDDHVVETRLTEFLADLGEQMGVSTGERREPEETGIFVPHRVHDLLRSAAQAGVNHLVTSVPKSASNDFGATVMTVEPGLGHHDAKGLVHGVRRGRFPINTTLFQLGLGVFMYRKYQEKLCFNGVNQCGSLVNEVSLIGLGCCNGN